MCRRKEHTRNAADGTAPFATAFVPFLLGGGASN